MSRSESLLTGEVDSSSFLYKKLLFDYKDNFGQTNNDQEYNLVTPKPGWCLKTNVDSGEKVFINICTSDLVLKPKDLTENEVRKIVESEDPTKFRIPMGIGEPHKEKDKSDKDVNAYDIVIHPEFFEKCKKIQFFKEFFIMLVFEGIENKFNISLSREYRILKNRKAVGSLRMQNVRSKATPVIMDMDSSMYELEKEAIAQQKFSISEVSTKKLSLKTNLTPPTYTVIQEPPHGYPNFLVIEIDLLKENSSTNFQLDVGEDCLIFQSNIYFLDITLPFNVDNEQTGAQYHCKTKKLTVTMPVLPIGV
ncbi:PIH1 domain-containing protein 1 isoform X2 [Hydra vulgaris]|uniref:PIH1 domain-containing protein 1 n=1 Tax=Hydra vulgaris TaxID=6087 RepID=A0ABM4BE56_HYDVU